MGQEPHSEYLEKEIIEDIVHKQYNDCFGGFFPNVYEPYVHAI